MATEKLEYEITDGGSTKKVTSATELLRKEADTTIQAFEKLGRVVKSSAAPKTTQTIKDATEESTGYAQARGSIGTGAAGRDFAKQAQGLGGLVHVYATFAANLFAVSAAFTALKEAAATENIVKGLDQLGASSGRNLGTLSKQLVATTDGALSLRDAMTAVAQASSAGLGNKQINDLALVAAKASNALGIGMSDAVSRLSRGISKIEPELLDEIGIFVKVNDATEKYALSVGKSASSLSDFEKRQAFANAVLEQGKQKFADIESAANPFDKLLASAANLATAGLQIVNKVLGPMASLLAESPMALSAVFAGIVALLVKQAIPALGQMREGLKDTATQALKSAEAFKSSFGDAFQTKLEQRFKIPDIEASVSKLEASLKKLDISKKVAASSGGKLLTLSEEDPKVLENANSMLKTRNTLIETGKRGTKDASEAQIAAARKERDDLIQIIALYKKRMELASARRGEQEVADKPIGALDPETIALKRYENMRQKAAQYDAVANAAQNAQILGIRGSWALLNQEIADKGIKGVAKYTTLASGGFAAVGSRVMGIASAFSWVGTAVAAAAAAFAIFDSWASKATKQQEDFNAKTEAAGAAVKTVNDTFALYTLKKKEAFTVEGVIAFSNTITQVADSLESQIMAFKEYRKQAGVWDDIKDAVASVFGKSNEQIIKKSAIEDIKSLSKSLTYSANGLQLLTEFANQFGINPADLEDTDKLNSLFKDLTSDQRVKKLEDIRRGIKHIADEEVYAAQATQSFKESLKEIDKIQDQIIASNAFTDLQGKLGVELVNASARFSMALQDPLKAVTALAELAKDPKALALFNAETLQGLQKAAVYTRDINAATQELEQAKEKKAKIKEGPGILQTIGNAMAGADVQDQIEQERKAALTEADKKVNELQVKSDKVRNDATSWAASQQSIVNDLAAKGFEKIELGLKKAKELANISIQKDVLSMAAGAGMDTSAQEYKLRVEEINIQKMLIEASYETQLATMANTEALAELTAVQQQLAAEAMASKRDATEADKKLAESMMSSAKQTLMMYATKRVMANPDADRETLKGLDPKARKAAEAALNLEKIPRLQKEAALAKLNADITIAGLQEVEKHEANILKAKTESNVADTARIAAGTEMLNLAASLGAYASEGLTNAKTFNQQESLRLEYATKIAVINAEQAKADRAKAAGFKDDDAKKEYDRVTALNAKKLETLTIEQRTKALTILVNAERDKGTAAVSALNQQSSVDLTNMRSANSVQEARIALQQKELDAKLQLGKIDDLTVIRRREDLELSLQKLKYDEQEAKLAADILVKYTELKAAKAAEAVATQAQAKAPTPETKQVMEAAQGKTAAAEQQFGVALKASEAAEKVNNLTVESIKANAGLNIELEKQKQHLSDIASITTSLSTVFGNFGKALGGVVTAFDSLSTSQEKRVAQLSELKQGSKEYKDLEARNARAQIVDYANIAGAAKGMFKEKTFAYKAFAAVEKTLHLVSLAMNVQKMISDAVGTSASVANSAIRTEASVAEAGVDGAAGVVKAISSMPFPLNLAAGAATAAVMAALLASIGGKSPKPPGGFTAAEQQKVQGTGQTFGATGTIVQRAGGVTGDVTAVADSVSSSIDSLNKAFFGMIGSSSSNIVKALEAIKDNTGETVKALLGKLVGFSSGSQFGTVESTSKTLGGIWGSSSTIIADVGITVKGFLQDLGEGLGQFQQYENIVKKSSSWFGLSKSTKYFTNVGDMPAAAQEAIENIFANVGTVLVNSAIALEGNATRVSDMLSQIPIDFKVSLKGLTGDEAAKAIMAEVSVSLNAAAEQVFPYIKKYNKIGEEIYETVARIVKDGEVLSAGLDMIGKAMQGINPADTVAFQQDLLTKVGGLDKFSSSIQYYFDNFLDAQTRFDYGFTSLTKTFKTAGVLLPTTKKEYMALIAAADATTETGRNTLATLLNNAESFDKLINQQVALNQIQIDSYKEQATVLTDTVTKFKDFSKTLKAFRDSLVLGSASIATPLEKYAEAKSQFESTYALALSGDKDAMSKLTGASSTFLDISKQLYASSDKYSTDFTYILDKLDAAGINAAATADVAQLQLDAINTQISYLSNINDNIALIAGVPAKAGGGLGRGLTLVGERGPELVDFSSPGRVYTADQTAGMFSGGGNMGQAIGAMVVEIQSLREEVCLLRKDQQKQTGDLIISNYDANQKVAEDVVAAVTTVSADSAWNSRSKSEIQ